METTTKRKQLRIYALEDLEIERKKGNVWITRNGKVYDVTTFVDDHPGGDDLIRQFAGKDIGEAMEDEEEHVHSDSAYTMLEEYLVGKLGKDGQVVSDDWVAEDDFHPDDTNVDDDYLQTEFLDLRKPLIRQMWEGNFSKSFYLQQVHQPRHLADSARLFGPEYLEIFTKTKWYVVPIVWLPISCYLFFRSSLQFSVAMPLGANNNNNNTMTPHTPSFYLTQPVNSPQTLLSSFPTLSDLATVNTTAWSLAIASFFLGNFVWTLLEYGFHRFLFHVDRLLPDKPAFLLIHFLTHGVHHYLPMDRLRLVMPPVLFFLLSFPMTRLAYLLFPVHMANGIISGAFAFYVLYDCMHYALHHTKLPTYMKEMKKYHLAHHYKNFDLGFGVTSKIWDYVFGTVLPV